MTVRFANVSYAYPGSTAGVFDIDFEVGAAELVAVIGASGSGKTTLLKLLSGFLHPDQGRIYVYGRDVTDVPPRKRDLGIVFQSYALFRHMTCWQNVAYPLKVRGAVRSARRDAALAALSQVNLFEFADRLPGTLSGGQQQRVALARALVFKPKALLLDEPLSALDAALRISMRDEISRVQRAAGIATLHVTHDQEEAMSIASRVAVMQQGRLAQIATPTALYDSPCSRSVAAFVGRANLWEATVVAHGRIDTAVGVLQCDTGSLAYGARAVAMVRPENVKAAPAQPDDVPNRFAGTVLRDRFLGAVRRYDFGVGDAVVLGETSSRGGIDAISIPPEAIRLLPANHA